MNLIAVRDWTMWLFELYICWILTAEYYYDFNKDIKKSKKTRTTKKTTTKPGGETVSEETTEISEPLNQGEPK